MSLLEAAKNSQPMHRAQRRKHDPAELLDLALAFARREITPAQVAAALSTRSPTNNLGGRLLAAIRAGDLTVSWVPGKRTRSIKEAS